MNYMKYTRSIVMLEEQDQNEAGERDGARGYLKIETGNNKGALRCVVQKLRYGKGDDFVYKYKLIFFGKKKEKTIHAVIGDLLVDRRGSGESYFRFDPLNLDGQGSPLSDFFVAIVAAASTLDKKEPLHPILRGYLEGADIPFPETAEESGAVIYGETDSLTEEGRLPVETPERQEAPRTQEAPETHGTPQTFNGFYNEHLLNFCNHISRVAGFYEPTAPFEDDGTGTCWLKISNVESLPLASPGAKHFARQHQHYLLGAKPDETGMAEKYYFAIPGQNLPEDQPDGGRSGFLRWQPLTGEREGSMAGYWIVAIDAATGDIEAV